jgi:hypothetical protein
LPVARYSGCRIETTLPRAPDRGATLPAPDLAPLLEEWATLRQANAALRLAVLWRKGSFGLDSETGSQLAERLLTVVATCRQQERPLLDFLVAAGEAALQGSPPPSLLAAP